MDNDIAQLIQERDKLKGQNEQLWAIVNKQKELIKQLKMQQNIGDTTDSTEDMIHQMGRDSKPINARIEGPGEKEIRQQSNGHFVAVGPPSPFELDNRKEEGKASKLSSTENLSNPLSVEPPRLNLQMFGSQTLAGADSNSELKKSLILGTPINERIDSRDKSLGKSLNSISEEPSLTSALSTQLINDLKTLEPLFVKSMKKVVDSKIKIYYIFQLWSNGNTLCFVEKAQDDFENLRKALDSNHKDVPFLPENRLYALGATGNILQGWIKNVCNLYPQDTALSKFMNSSIIDQNDLRESFKKQGMLYKKGNYFGVWKARYYELDTATGTIFYSEQKGGESTGNFSLKYAYCGQYVPQAGDKQDEEYPGFVVTEYRKNFFAKQPDLEPRNADGLPSGKVEVRHVFHAESVDERDHWLRCISGVIARFRTDDRVAQYFFTLTTPPNPAELKSTRSSVKKNAEAKTEPKSEAKTEPRPETAKSEIKATSPSVAAPFSDTISPSMSMPDQISRVHTVKLKFNNNEETKTSPQRRNLSNGAIIPSGGVVDDQTRCLQQDFPPSLAQELPLKLVGKSAAETGKKKNNFFRDLIKRNTDSGQKQKFSIFGSTLKEATELTRISPNIDMPAIIYRCIEYVETKNRKFILTDYCEEGIYRLSGASSVIAALKTRFEEDGDCNLVESYTYYDPHAVAGLLKLFFRELAEPIFNNELRAELFKITEYESREDRISAIKEILPYLPRINYTCLRVLVAHLLRVVMSSDKNKMTVRNIAIVFSPTLGIPAGLFTILLAEFPIIFAWKTDDTSRELIAQRNVQRPSISGSKSTTSVQPKFNDLQTHVEEQQEKNSEMIQALADQLGQDEDVTDVGTDNQEKLRELLK